MSSLILAGSFPESVRRLVAWGGFGYLTKECTDVTKTIAKGYLKMGNFLNDPKSKL